MGAFIAALAALAALLINRRLPDRGRIGAMGRPRLLGSACSAGLAALASISPAADRRFRRKQPEAIG
jgi:hypothetical protein